MLYEILFLRENEVKSVRKQSVIGSMKFKLNIKWLLFFQFVSVMLFLLGALYYGLHYMKEQNIEGMLTEMSSSVGSLYDDIIKMEMNLIQVRAENIMSNEKLQHEFIKRNRKELYTASKVIYKENVDKFKIIHLGFVDLDRRMFLRMHAPERFGDIPQLESQLLANDRNSAYSIEFNTSDELVLRVVVPWSFDGKHQGYLMLSKVLENIAIRLKKIVNAEVMIYIHKNIIPPKDKVNNDLNIGDYYLLFHTIEDVSLFTKLMEETQRSATLQRHFHFSERGYGSIEIPLKKNSGAQLGKIVVYVNITKKEEALRELIIILYVFVGISSIVFFGFFAGKILRLHQKVEDQKREKDEFLGIVSHDLKAPLASIKTSLDIISESIESSKNISISELLSSSKRSVHNAINLVTDFLDKARVADEMKMEMEVFNITNLLNECVDTFRHSIAMHKLDLVITTEKDYEVFCDYKRTVQVMNNLLSNAVKYSPDGGKIKITLDIFKNSHKNGRLLQISFFNEGRPIPEDKVETIFEKFVQVSIDDRKKGSGLGLAIAKRICRAQGGDIWVERNIADGVLFMVTLPLASTSRINSVRDKKNYDDIGSDENNLNKPDNIHKELSRANPKILIAEDNEEVQIIMRVLLDKISSQLDIVGNGEEALAMLSRKSYDIILLDIEMPIMNGVEAAKKIKEMNLKIPVVALTSHMVLDKAKFMMETGFDDYIAKPFEVETLTTLLAQKLNSNYGK